MQRQMNLVHLLMSCFEICESSHLQRALLHSRFKIKIVYELFVSMFYTSFHSQFVHLNIAYKEYKS
jgi:hypothetical protein